MKRDIVRAVIGRDWCCSRSRTRELNIKTTFVVDRLFLKALEIRVYSLSWSAQPLRWFCWFRNFHRTIRCLQVAFERFKLVLWSSIITPQSACIVMPSAIRLSLEMLSILGYWWRFVLLCFYGSTKTCYIEKLPLDYRTIFDWHWGLTLRINN